MEETYLYIEAWTQADGSIRAFKATNDEYDRGYPSGYDQWEITYQNRSRFDKGCGESTIGWTGTVVIVILDGRKLTEVTK